MGSKGFVPNLTLFTAWGAIMVAIITIIMILIGAGAPADWRIQEGFLGTGASKMADFTVLAYVLLLVPSMLVGFVFARNKKFVPHHQVIMTLIVILNWGLISFIMANSFKGIGSDIPDNINDKFYALPGIHFLFGITAQLLGTYLVIRMWFEDALPDALKIRKIKPVMRLTLACWLIAATLGILTYITWYDPFGEDADVSPLGTPELTDVPSDSLLATEAVTDATPAATEEAAPLATEEPTEAAAIPEPTEEVAEVAEAATPVPTEEVLETPVPVETEAVVIEIAEATEEAIPVETEEVAEITPVETEVPAETPEVTEVALLQETEEAVPVETEEVEIEPIETEEIEIEPAETEEIEVEPVETEETTEVPVETPVPAATEEVAEVIVSEAQSILDIQFGNQELKQLNVFLPAGAQPFPTVLILHGGTGTRTQFDHIAQHLNEIGFAAVEPTLERATGEDDGFCALAWVMANAAQYGFDTDNLFVMGWDMGGGIAANIMAADDTSDMTFNCPIPVPEPQLAGTILLAPTFQGNRADPWNETSNPVVWMDSGDPPVLIVHGGTDGNTAISSSQTLLERLTSAGIVANLVTLPSSDHFFPTAIENTGYNDAISAIDAFLTTITEITPDGG